MAAKKRELAEREVQGVKQLRKLLPLFERLRSVGCERDKAGNRVLHMDEYCVLIFLFLFNPILTSLRGVQQASELKKVQKKLGCPRTSLGSLSEATAVFRAEGLREIVGELTDRLGALPHDRRLDGVTPRLTAVDGSLLTRLPQITQNAWQSGRHPDGWRLHAHFEVLRGVPTNIEVTTGRNREDANEKASLRRLLEADCCYILDRGYEQFSLFNAIVAAQSSYVCRVRGDHHFTPEQARVLTPEGIEAGVVQDAVGRLGSPKSVRIEHPDHAVRLVRIRGESHPKRGDASSQDIVLATNLLEVPADVVALVYTHRWQVELFFRFFKHTLGCRHLLSEDPVGIEIQTYCAVIVCLLVSLWTGKKPTLRTFEMIRFYLTGWADQDEVLAHLEKLKPHAE